MTAITRYPVDASHDPLYRGDPQSISVTIKDNVGTEDVPVWQERELAGTFWRAHVRSSEDASLLTRWDVIVLEDLPGATPADVGKLLLSMSDVESRNLINGCQWDLEQVDNDADDDTTHSLGTYWKVRAARVEKDVSHDG